MSLQIDTANRIRIDGKDTGLALSQTREKTIVYTPERRGLGQINKMARKPTGRNALGIMQWVDCVEVVDDVGARYKEHSMPFNRYSAAHDEPHKPGEAYNPAVCAGRIQLESDVRALLARLKDV